MEITSKSYLSPLSTPKIAAAKRAEKPAGGALDNPELHALETQLASDGITSDAPFSVYDDIRSKLVALGIPCEQIAYIHEANTEVRKKELFAKVRSGQVRVLMGSTFKMGAGITSKTGSSRCMTSTARGGRAIWSSAAVVSSVRATATRKCIFTAM